MGWDVMGWYEAFDSHPTVGWYGILLVSSYGTGDLWDRLYKIRR